MTLVWFAVRFCKKNCSLRFGFGFTKLTAVSVFSVRLGLHSFVDVGAIFHLRLYGMTLEITYFHPELVQLIVSRKREIEGDRERERGCCLSDKSCIHYYACHVLFACPANWHYF